MSKTIIICSDGTGNTFDRRVTNVTHLVKCLALDDHSRQVVVYDQGVGTNGRRHRAVEEYRNGVPDPQALQIPPGLVQSSLSPKTWLDRSRGLLFGRGLRENVREMYQALADLYGGPEDKVFLFGFSRGAFTVRALAGLLYRCQLPQRGCSDFDRRFEEAWRLYEPIDEDAAATARFCEQQRPCRVHFLGLWDTVKSYGGLDPVILPHLRHNPIVKNVRHCLALDERRAWYKPTTWGLLDLDKDGAMKRLKEKDLPLYEEQKKNIAEMWFRGSHSDIGGGYEDDALARITLRWMLGEAVNVHPRLILNDHGKELLQPGPDDPAGTRETPIHESWNRGWGLVEAIPRGEIDNSLEKPFKKCARGSDGKREPEKLRRGGKVFLHASVGNAHGIPGEIEMCQTKGLPDAAQPPLGPTEQQHAGYLKHDHLN